MPTQHNTKTASLLALALLLLGIDTENFNDDISQTLVWLDLPDTISGNRGIFLMIIPAAGSLKWLPVSLNNRNQLIDADRMRERAFNKEYKTIKTSAISDVSNTKKLKILKYAKSG